MEARACLVAIIAIESKKRGQQKRKKMEFREKYYAYPKKKMVPTKGMKFKGKVRR